MTRDEVMKLEDWRIANPEHLESKRPIWTSWPDGWHYTAFKGLYVRFKFERRDFLDMDVYEMHGEIENWVSPKNPRLFLQRVSTREFVHQKVFATPLDMFKHLAEATISWELPKRKPPCLSFAPDWIVMSLHPDGDGMIRGYCELDRGHEGPHRRGKHQWEKKHDE